MIHILGDKRKSRFDPDLADKFNKRAEEEERRELLEQKLRKVRGEAVPATPIIEPATPATEPIVSGNYILMPQTSTWVKGKDALQQESLRTNNQNQPQYGLPNGSKVYRPLTFEENIRARVEDYHSHKRDDPERLRLFNTWLDSCTGIAYKKGTRSCKLITQSPELINLPSGFNKPFVAVDYDSVQNQEFDLTQIATGRNLAKSEILNHALWNYVVPDKKLLEEHLDIVFREIKIQQGMGFYVLNSPAEDQLRALCVGYLGSRSNANGIDNLVSSGSFLRRVTPVVSSAAGGTQKNGGQQ